MNGYTDLLEWLDSKGKLSDYNCYKDASEAIRQLIAERGHYKEECLEQARLLGISGERELKLIAERENCIAALTESTKLSDNLYSKGHRLALELECLLLDTKDTAIQSKWWDSAHEALEDWRK